MAKRRKATGTGRDWRNRLQIDQTPLMSEELGRNSFHEFVNLVADDAIDILTESGRFATSILAVDSSWRSLHIFDGAEGTAPVRFERGRPGVVRVRGALMDGLPVVREIFGRLDIKAAILRAEAWSGMPSDSLLGASRVVTRANSFGRGETLVVEALFPGASYYRFMDCPIVRMDSLVTAGVLHDTAEMEDWEAVESPLSKCFPFRTRTLRRVN